MTRAYKQKPLDRLFHVQQQRKREADQKAELDGKMCQTPEQAQFNAEAQKQADTDRVVLDFDFETIDWREFRESPGLFGANRHRSGIDVAPGPDRTAFITLDSLAPLVESGDFSGLEERVTAMMRGEILARMREEDRRFERELLIGTPRRPGQETFRNVWERNRERVSGLTGVRVLNWPIQAATAEMQRSVEEFGRSLNAASLTAAEVARSMERASSLMRGTHLSPDESFRQVVEETRIQMASMERLDFRIDIGDMNRENLASAFGLAFGAARVRYPARGEEKPLPPDAPPHPETGMVVHRPLRTMGGIPVEGVRQADGTVKYRPVTTPRQFTRSATKGNP